MAVEVRGAKEIEAVLKAMPERIAKNVVVNSLRAGARIIAKQARANLRANPSIDSGMLEKNVTSRARKRSKQGSAVVSVGIARATAIVKRRNRKKAVKASPSKYAHLVEFGREGMAAEPFLRPALDEKAIEAIGKIGEFLGKGVEREAAKLAAGKTSFVSGKRRS
jgi:HK97 gp10 family phage protein